MKFGLSAALGTFILGVGLAQTSAHAVTLPSKLKAESAVTEVTFWREHEEKEHAKKHRAHKRHAHAHWHAHHHDHHVKKKKH
jgi:hypothetical protein